MVFFVCEGCNESLKKNKVDQHAERCKNCWAVTCVDCSKVFEGDDYRAHTSCISEAEKYQGACYQGGENSNKKKTISAQDMWIRSVQNVVCTDTKLKSFVTLIQEYDNVPRKKPKFLNFVSNSINVRNPKAAEALFILFSAEFDKAMALSKQPEPELPVPVEKKEKRKFDETDEVKITKIIRKKLKHADDKSMAVKDLKEKVVGAFLEKYPKEWSRKVLKKEFKRLIQSVPHLTIDDDGKKVLYSK